MKTIFLLAALMFCCAAFSQEKIFELEKDEKDTEIETRPVVITRGKASLTLFLADHQKIVETDSCFLFYGGYSSKSGVVVRASAKGYSDSKIIMSGSGASMSSRGDGKYELRFGSYKKGSKISVSTGNSNNRVRLGDFYFVFRPAIVKE